MVHGCWSHLCDIGRGVNCGNIRYTLNEVGAWFKFEFDAKTHKKTHIAQEETLLTTGSKSTHLTYHSSGKWPSQCAVSKINTPPSLWFNSRRGRGGGGDVAIERKKGLNGDPRSPIFCCPFRRHDTDRYRCWPWKNPSLLNIFGTVSMGRKFVSVREGAT